MNEVEIIRHNLIAAGLLAGYALRLWEWTDEDSNGQADVIRIGFTGTGGGSDFILSSTDVSIQMLAGAGSFVQGRARMDAIKAHFYALPRDGAAMHFEPIGQITGPSRLANGRRRFELVIRVVTVRA